MKRIIILSLVFSLILIGNSLANTRTTTYLLNCPETSIKGSIPYSVVGTYSAVFKQCSGKIIYDNSLQQVKSVDLTIRADSLESNWKGCDRIAKSRRLLDVAKYPFITFKAKDFVNSKDGSWVSGIFGVRGVYKNMRFRFNFEKQRDDTLFVTGVWKFNRKSFNIIWSHLLDHGGILVGNYFTVSWEAKAHKI